MLKRLTSLIRLATRRTVVALGVAALVCAGLAAPVHGQFPEPDCDPATWPANAAIPPAAATYCADNPGMSCSLEIFDWSLPGTPRSTDLRIGSEIDGSPEQPHFLFDSAGNRFYAKLYVKFRNDGLGPAPAGQVSVDLDFKAGETPADPTDNTGWTSIGTYDMRIPAPAPVGALFPSQSHVQDGSRPLCWTFAAGDTDLPRKFTLRASVDWAADDDTSNNQAFSFYDLTVQERPAQIGFAMDLSGSMAGSRLIQAQQKAGLFTHLIEDGDQLGVYGFATDHPNNDAGIPVSFTPTPAAPQVNLLIGDTSEIAPIQTLNSLADRVGIAGAIASQNTANCTPVGQGLLRARREMLAQAPPANAQRAIVVFSDGLQNVPPFVNALPPSTCGGAPAGSLIDAAATFGDDDIEIYSVFFSSAWAYGFGVMNDIQNQTGGDLLYGAASEAELASAYFSIRALVDDMVYLEENGATSPSRPAEFEIDFGPGATQATVALSWPTADRARLAMECREKGSTTWSDCDPNVQASEISRRRNDSYRVFRFQPGPGTTWQFRVVQQAPTSGRTSYSAAVYTPVREAQIFPSLDNVGFEAGRPLPIRATLLRDGVGVTGASVEAKVRVPSRNFGATLRRYAGRLQVPTVDDDSRAQAVIGQLQGFLRNDTGSDAVYVYRDVRVTLRDDGQGADETAGDGNYAGVLPASETEVAGDYQVTITARKTLASGQTVERIAKLSALCDVGPADPERSDVRVVLQPDPAGDVRLATVTVLPTDRFGNAAFPGSGPQIRVQADGATLQGGLVDRLDSTFTQVMRVPAGANPDVRVQVGDVSLHPVPVVPGAGSGGAGAAEYSFHLGLASPRGSFGTIFDDGLSVAIDYGRTLSNSLAWKAELAVDDFDAPVGSEEMTSLALYLQHRWTGAPWTPYFEGGVGVYDVFDTSAFGTAIGLGAQRRITPTWSLDANLQGHRVGGDLDLSFSRLRLGLIYQP